MEVLEGASGTSTRRQLVAVCQTKGFGEHTVNKALDVMEVAKEIKINKKKKPHAIRLRRKTA